MPCLNCKSRLLSRVKEVYVCGECGLVNVSKIVSFSESVDIDREFIDLTLLYREWDLPHLDEAKRYMRSAYVYIHSGKFSMAEMSATVAHIHMRNLDRPTNLYKHCKYLGIRTTKVKRMIDRLKDFWDVYWHYNIEEAHRLCDTLEVDFDIEVMQKVADEMVLTPSIITAVVYMTSDMSHRKVANLFNLSATNVLNKKKKLEEII